MSMGRCAPMMGASLPCPWEGVLPCMGGVLPCMGALLPCMGGGAPMHRRGAPMGMGAMLPSWEHSAPYAMGAASLTHGSRAPMPWERRSHGMGAGPKRGRSAPMGSRYGSTSGPAPMHGRGGSHDMGAGRNFWVSGAEGGGRKKPLLEKRTRDNAHARCLVQRTHRRTARRASCTRLPAHVRYRARRPDQARHRRAGPLRDVSVVRASRG